MLPVVQGIALLMSQESGIETVKTKDFLRIGVPFTLSAVLAGDIYIWIVWGV